MSSSQRQLQKGFNYNYRRHPHTKKLVKTTLLHDINSSSIPNLGADCSTRPNSSPKKRNSIGSNDDIPKNSPKYLEKLIRSIFLTNNPSANIIGLSSSPKKTPSQTKEPLLSESLPALTSSTTIDLSLYALIGLFIREFVLSWYTRFSVDPNQDFMTELLGVSAHITRGIQQRCTSPDLDWGEIIFDDLPSLLIRHFASVKEAQRRVGSRLSFDIGAEHLDDEIQLELAQVYSQLNPHFALKFEDYMTSCKLNNGNKTAKEDVHEVSTGNQNENVDIEAELKGYTMNKEIEYNKLLSKGFVSLILPFEELDSVLSREFINSIVSDLILKNLVENLSDNFAIWGIIDSIVQTLDESNKRKQLDAKEQEKPETKGLISIKETFASGGRRIGHIIAYSTSVFTSNGSSEIDHKSKRTKKGENNVLSYSIFQFLIMTFNLRVRFPIIISIFALIGNYLSKSNAILHLFNNLCYNFVWNKLLHETMICSIVNLLRKIFFPEDLRFTSKKRYVPESKQELEQFRLKCRNDLIQYLSGNKLLMKTIYSTGETSDIALQNDIETFINLFDNKFINKHLLWNIIDLLLIKLFPELTTHTPSDMINH